MRPVAPSLLIGRITWKSKRYPDKSYEIVCFSPEMHVYVALLIRNIPDYYSVTPQLHRKQ